MKAAHLLWRPDDPFRQAIHKHTPLPVLLYSQILPLWLQQVRNHLHAPIPGCSGTPSDEAFQKTGALRWSCRLDWLLLSAHMWACTVWEGSWERHLIVDLQVRCPHEVLAARGCVVLNVGKHIFHSSRDDAPFRTMLLTLHGVRLACSCLPVGNDGRIVALLRGEACSFPCTCWFLPRLSHSLGSSSKVSNLRGPARDMQRQNRGYVENARTGDEESMRYLQC